MWIDLIALGVLGAFAGVGALRGAVASATGLASLVVGYVAAWMAAQHFGTRLAGDLGVPSVAGPPLAGSLGFLVGFVLAGGVGTLLQGWDKRRRGSLPRSGADRALGGAFGVLRGGLIVLLLGWSALWLDAARVMSGGERFAAAPDASRSLVASASGAVVGKAVEAALDDGEGGAGGARVAGRMAARPAETLQAIQGLLEDDRVRAIQNDRMFWTYVQNGAVGPAMNRASFYHLAQDEEIRRQLGDLGLVDREATEDPTAFREASGEVLAQIGPRIKGLAEDPELQRLARDPEILSLIERGDTLALMQHPDIQRLVARVSEGL